MTLMPDVNRRPPVTETVDESDAAEVDEDMELGMCADNEDDADEAEDGDIMWANGELDPPPDLYK